MFSEPQFNWQKCFQEVTESHPISAQAHLPTFVGQVCRLLAFLKVPFGRPRLAFGTFATLKGRGASEEVARDAPPPV